MKRENFCKDDFKTGDIVTLRNGDRLIVTKTDFYDIDENNDNDLCCISELKDNLKIKEEGTFSGKRAYINDIMKVERPTQYKITYEREEVKEMTLAQVCEELGYKVKIIKEE